MQSTLSPQKILQICREAGAKIMEFYSQPIEVIEKEDHSPLTQADLAANSHITQALEQFYPDIPVVSEENAEKSNIEASQNPCFWLVDPLDGTKSFIKKTGEFTVNIALVEDGRPTMGFIYVPAQGVSYFTGENGKVYTQKDGEEAVEISTRPEPADGVVVVASKSHSSQETVDYINTLHVKERRSAASSLKLCLVAEGKADIYPRFGRTMEWDIAAGQAILEKAGGSVYTLEGKPLRYGKPGLDNPNFVAKGWKG